ncbi:MAG: chromosomal replication initiator protein DnaA, partial [Pseudomonadota bacterium]
RVKTRLKAALGEATFKSWLSSLQYQNIESHQVNMHVPTRFMREWIMSHYAEDILRFWQMEYPALLAIDINVKTSKKSPITETVLAEPAKTGTSENKIGENKIPANSDNVQSYEYIGSALDPRFTFDNFIVGKPNELAHAAARRVADNDTVMQGCNPLFLYGGVGLGKTHLMHSIAWQIRMTNPARKVIYLSAEQFMYQFIRALRFKESLAFKEQFRSVDVLMIDDVQFIIGKDSTQEEFFHTFNALVDQHKQLVISCDRSSSDVDGMEERIRSRLGWGLVADIHATTYELRLGILQAKLEKMHDIAVPQKVVEFLAHKITSNVRELEGALNRVVAHATLVGRAITLETTQDVLHDLLRANDRKVTIEDIQKQVASHFNIKVSDMHSARRSVNIARPRQIAMYLAKKLTSKSLPEIGRRFGGKDHTTVMHAVKKVEELSKIENEFAQNIDLLIKILQN